MSEELTLLQKLMTSKPSTRRITTGRVLKPATATSKPPTRRITSRGCGSPSSCLLSRLHGG